MMWLIFEFYSRYVRVEGVSLEVVKQGKWHIVCWEGAAQLADHMTLAIQSEWRRRRLDVALGLGNTWTPLSYKRNDRHEGKGTGGR
jgi:hypothetical protein